MFGNVRKSQRYQVKDKLLIRLKFLFWVQMCLKQNVLTLCTQKKKSLYLMWRDYTARESSARGVRWLTLLWNIKGRLSLNLDKILQQARYFHCCQVELSEQVRSKANYPLSDNAILELLNWMPWQLKSKLLNFAQGCSPQAWSKSAFYFLEIYFNLFGVLIKNNNT